MKILFVTTVSSTVDAFLIPHIKLLVEQGQQVDVAFNIIREVSPELKKMGCKIFNIGFNRSPLKKENFTAYKKIKKLVIEGGYDIVHTHTPIASFITRLACRNNTNLKMLYTAHGFHFFRGAPIKNWLMFYPMELVAAKYTDGIITMNQEDYDAAKKMKLRKINSVYKMNGVGINFEKYSNYNAFSKLKLRKKYGYKSNEFILFYAAELNFNKHQDLLLNALSILKHKIPEIKLLLAGDGPLTEKLKLEVNKLGLQKNVEFLGYRSDVPNLLKLSDLAVASSRREGLPVNIMEAMATGLPLVVTNCRGHRDLVEDGYNGFVVETEDYQAFATAIEKVYKSEELIKRFSVNNIKKVTAYSHNNVLEELKDIYSNYLE